MHILGRSHGERVKLPDYVQQNKPALLREYRTLSDSALDAMVAAVQGKRDMTVQGARANPKAVNHTVTAAFSQMDRDVRCNSFVDKSNYFITSGQPYVPRLEQKDSILPSGARSKISRNQNCFLQKKQRTLSVPS